MAGEDTGGVAQQRCASLRGHGRPPSGAARMGRYLRGGVPMVAAILIVLAVLLVLGLSAVASSVRVLREYERGVVFRLGRLMEQRGPGLVLLLPTIDRMVRISLRTVTLTVPPQEIITRDNVPARVTAVAYYRVIDPSKAVTEVESFQ